MATDGISAEAIFRRLQRWQSRIPEIVQKLAEEEFQTFGERVSEHIDSSGPEPGERSTSGQIGNQSYRLSDALFPGDENNRDRVESAGIARHRIIFEMDTTPSGIFYGPIQEEARPFWEPGARDYSERDATDAADLLMDRLRRAFEATD
jgi:hypothetical protein